MLKVCTFWKPAMLYTAADWSSHADQRGIMGATYHEHKVRAHIATKSVTPINLQSILPPPRASLAILFFTLVFVIVFVIVTVRISVVAFLVAIVIFVIRIRCFDDTFDSFRVCPQL